MKVWILYYLPSYATPPNFKFRGVFSSRAKAEDAGEELGEVFISFHTVDKEEE